MWSLPTSDWLERELQERTWPRGRACRSCSYGWGGCRDCPEIPQLPAAPVVGTKVLRVRVQARHLGTPGHWPSVTEQASSPASLPSFCSLRSSAQPNQHHLPLSTAPSSTTSLRPQAPDPQSAQQSVELWKQSDYVLPVVVSLSQGQSPVSQSLSRGPLCPCPPWPGTCSLAS